MSLPICERGNDPRLPFSFPDMSGFTLYVEDRNPIASPSIHEVAASVRALTPHGGPSFLIVEGPNNEFAQTAGGDGRFTVEWKEEYGEGYCQWKAGLPIQQEPGEVKVKTNGYVVRVRTNEVLCPPDVITILGAFLSGGVRPKGYHWRKMPIEEFSN